MAKAYRAYRASSRDYSRTATARERSIVRRIERRVKAQTRKAG